MQPRNCKFSSVGILDSMSHQKKKEWDGGMHGHQIEEGHSSLSGGGFKN